MDLDFSDEQQMLGEMVQGVCAAYSSFDTVRAMEDDPVGFPDELWKQLIELDLVGLLLPSEYGGSAMTALEGAILYRELGRALAPTPHFVSAVMSAGTLVRAGTDEQRSWWLPRIVGGEVLTTAWLEPGNGFGPRGVQTRAVPDGTDFLLSGVKWHVPFARSAAQFVVLARTSDSDIDLFLVDPTTDGVRLTQQYTIASDTQYEVELIDVRVPAANRVGIAGSGWSTWHDTMLDGIVLLAAYAVGAARYALDITVQYAKDREQFDKPLGAFQAISHYLADAATAVDGAETLVYEAAWSRANGRDISRLAPMAKLFACSTFRDVTAMAQQIFGGVGFTVEYDIQLYFRRAKQLQISWWDEGTLEELIAASVFDG